MAYALSNNNSAFNISARLSQMADAWRTARTYRQVFNQTYNELQALSDRDLADIGIERSEIGSISRDEAKKVL